MISFLIGAIRMGMALLLGSTGEIITEKSGHLNLGIPGVMCVGAAFGCGAESIYYKACMGNLNPVLAVIIPILSALLGGFLMGLIYSFMTVTLRTNQNVTGLALTTFGVGVSTYIMSYFSTDLYYTSGSKFFTAYLPIANKLGGFGKLLFSYGILVYIAIAVAIASAIVLKKTRIGLHLRAVGENPATADAAGINVSFYRYGATCIGSAIAGLGGLAFIMDFLNGNWEYMIDAIGWLCVALVIFTVWSPLLAIPGSIIFGILYNMSYFITGAGFITTEVLKMLPYIVTVLVLIFTSIRNKRDNQPPASLGVNYYREER